MLGQRHPRQGPRPQPVLGVLVRHDGRHRPEPRASRPTSSTYPGRAAAARRRPARPVDAGPANDSRCRSSASCAGYLSGSGWKEYQETGAVCGIALPAGLRESDRLPAPIFTPATKAESGHDVNITEAEAGAIVGADVIARAARPVARDLPPRRGARRACGIIVADTKFEFGVVADGAAGETLILIDEVLTPDSSRFWPADAVPAGRRAAELRQAVRPRLPRDRSAGTSSRRRPRCRDDVVAQTREKYLEAYRLLTGRELD